MSSAPPHPTSRAQYADAPLPVVWAPLGTLLALALGGRIVHLADVEARAAAGAAV